MSDNINGFPVPEEPETREEQYLSAIAQVTPATQIPPEPLTRVEAYLNKIVENGTGGGGGGTTNYNALENKPQINSHELSGNKSSSDLGLQAALTETQLAAVNSGIDSTKVQQISTNTTNISSFKKATGANVYYQETQPVDTIPTGSYWISTLGNKVYGGDVTYTSLPQTISYDSITAYTINGNMVQSGTPAVDNPIYPSECGDIVQSGEHTGQYAIPIVCGETTTTVYIGDVQSTRQIKKLTLTGEEEFTQTSNYGQASRFRLIVNEALRGTGTYSIDTIISSHYTPATGFAVGTIVQSNGTDINMTFNMQSSAYPDLTTFTRWIATQYANGTPVTVWYVLATPTTTTLNEPLRKIGNYADSVSGGSITTSGISETFDVDTTLEPSAVTLTVTGWH